MAKEKDNSKKKVDKKIEESEEEKTKKSIEKKEGKQLFWFFFIIIIAFASFLVPYFYVQSQKTFEYSHINWAIEDYENLRIYHGRFPTISNPNNTFNIFHRTDPRENTIETTGNFTKFKYYGIISFTPETYTCSGELSRSMLDLSSFLSEGIGLGKIEAGYTDKELANSSNAEHITCNNTNDRTVIEIRLGEPKIIQDEQNPYCYIIYSESCKTAASVEKFIVKSVDDLEIKREEIYSNITKEN